MSLLEIILLVLLVVSLVANFRLWQYFQSYKTAYRNAVSYTYHGPGIFETAMRAAPIFGLGVTLFFIYKKLQSEGVFKK